MSSFAARPSPLLYLVLPCPCMPDNETAGHARDQCLRRPALPSGSADAPRPDSTNSPTPSATPWPYRCPPCACLLATYPSWYPARTAPCRSMIEPALALLHLPVDRRSSGPTVRVGQVPASLLFAIVLLCCAAAVLCCRIVSEERK